MTKLLKQDLKLSFQVPIVEKFVKEAEGEGNESSDFTIRGTAINATITSNGHEFIADELKKSAKSLCDKPLLKDHINSVDSIVGRTTQGCKYDDKLKAIIFEAKVMDEVMQDKIEKGMVDSVSVGAMVDKVLYDEERDVAILQGIHFKELSLVAVPADENANFAKAIAVACSAELGSKEISQKPLESLEAVGSASKDSSKVEEKTKQLEDKKMEQEKFEQTIQEKDSVIEQLQNDAKEKAEKLEAFEKAELKRVETELKEARESYKKLAEEKGVTAVDVSEASKDVVELLTKQLEGVKEAKEEETEEKVDNSKGIVAKSTDVDAEEDLDDYLIVKEGTTKGVGVFKNPYKASESSVYHRL